MHSPFPKHQALTVPAAKPRPRRERRANRQARAVVRHLVMPGMELAQAEIKPRETVAGFLRRIGWATFDKAYGWQFKKGLPTILEINGEAVLRKHWRRRRIAANDNARFVSYPLGGGGSSTTKQVVGLVALVAVAAFAIWAGPLIAGSTLVGGLATAAIATGGSLLVNALVNPNAGATNNPAATTDQIYSVSAAGNVAKLGQPLPVWYGQLLSYPDFAATPWGEFIGNDQYLNVLLSVGMGSLDYAALYVDQTVLWDPVNGVNSTFSATDSAGNIGAQVAFYEPGATVTLFPVNVDSSIEVSGQQFPDGSGDSYQGTGVPVAVLGPFITNPSATLASSIVVDFVFPGGCYAINNSQPNNYLARPFRLIAQYAPVNDAGTITGSFTTLFDITRNYCSSSPIRDSIKTDVTPGRYTVRVQRGDETAGSPSVSLCLWAGLRSYLQGSNSFPDVATVAIRILATLSTQGSYKFGVLATRKLPVWNGSAFVTQATRNPAWAFLDAVTNSQYGSGLPITNVDFNSVTSLAAGADTRGDSFDYMFSSAVSVPAALDKILAPTRAKHFWLGDTVSLVRDEWRDVPSMMLTDREIVRDSTQVTWTMLGDEDPDALILEYVDNGTWLPAQVQYPPNSDSFTAANAEVKRLDGITDRAQAYRECAFFYLQSIYRREAVQIGCEYEGRAITLGSVLRLQSELPQAYGWGGAVVAVSGDSLTLDPAPVWDAGPFYIRLRMPNGTYFGPVLCTQGGDATIAVLDASSLSAAQTAQSTTLAAVLARETGGEYPSFELGTATTESKLCLVLSGVPNGELCTLSMVVDDERVHATDLGDPPTLPTAQYPSNASVPLIVGLNANFGQGIAEPQLSASWFPTAGAISYIAEVSYDSGQTWSQIYGDAGNSFSKTVTLAALTLRVQAVTPLLHGPYSSVTCDAPTIVISSQTVALSSLIAGLQFQVTTALDDLQATANAVNQLIGSIGSIDIARNWLDKQQLRSELSSQTNNTLATITQVDTTLTDATDALAERALALETSVNDPTTGLSVTASTTQTLYSEITNGSTGLGAVNSTLGSLSGSLGSLGNTVSVISGEVTALQDTVNDPTNGVAVTASAVQGLYTQVNAGGGLAAQVTSLNSQVGDLNGQVGSDNNALAIQANLTSQLLTAVSDTGLDVSFTYPNGSAVIDPTTGTPYTSKIKSISAQVGSLSTTVGGHTSTLNTVQASIDGLYGQYGVTISIDGTTGGYVLSGVEKLDGTVSYTLAIDGNVIVSGSVQTASLATGAVTAVKIKAGAITSDSGVIGALSVKSLSIGDNAVTVPIVQTVGVIGGVGSPRTIYNFPITVDTTGLAGKTITFYVNIQCQVNFASGYSHSTAAFLFINPPGATGNNLVQSYSTPEGTPLPFFVLTGGLQVLGTGGLITVQVIATWNSSANNNSATIESGTCFAEGIIR
jgi:hypothetical protein